jgi:protein-tyrosine phosphatase
MTRVLFVCLGNICRSPTAEGVFRSLLQKRGLTGMVEADSCGTSAWHVGESPDARSAAEAARRGYDLRALRGRQIELEDFRRFDYILAMDYANLAELETMCPADYPGHLGLFLGFAAGADSEEVPDPYYGGDDGFAHVLDLVEAASEGGAAGQRAFLRAGSQ